MLTDFLGAALDDEAAFRAEVRAGLDAHDQGEDIDHEEAKQRLRAAIEPHGARV